MEKAATFGEVGTASPSVGVKSEYQRDYRTSLPICEYTGSVYVQDGLDLDGGGIVMGVEPAMDNALSLVS